MAATSPRRRLPRPTTLTTHLRRADGALARQEGHLVAARDALSVLRELRDERRREAEGAVAPERAGALRQQADELTRQLTVLGRQLESLEHAEATARAQAVGLRRIEEEAATDLPFAAGPVAADGLPDLDGVGGSAGGRSGGGRSGGNRSDGGSSGGGRSDRGRSGGTRSDGGSPDGGSSDRGASGGTSSEGRGPASP